MSEKLIKLIESGKNNKEIAKILGCHPATVSKTKKRLGIIDSEARKRAGRKPKIK